MYLNLCSNKSEFAFFGAPASVGALFYLEEGLMNHFYDPIYPEGFTNEQKCKLWIESGLAGKHHYELLLELMEQHNPQNASDNRVVFSKLLFLSGEVTEEEYEQLLQSAFPDEEQG